MVKFSTTFRDIVQNKKAPMEARREAAEKARQEKLDAADPKKNYELSVGYCRREGDASRHDHRSRYINTQDRTACQFNCDANEDCVAFEMAPRCWWYSRDTDLAGSGQAKKECWVKKPVTAPTDPEPIKESLKAKIDVDAKKCAMEGEHCECSEGSVWYGQPGSLDELKNNGHSSKKVEKPMKVDIAKSKQLGGATKVVFKNPSENNIDIYWSDWAGNLKKYNTLKPQASYTQSTYVGHSWVLKVGDDYNTQCVAKKDTITCQT